MTRLCSSTFIRFHKIVVRNRRLSPILNECRKWEADTRDEEVGIRPVGGHQQQVGSSVGLLAFNRLPMTKMSRLRRYTSWVLAPLQFLEF